MDLPEPDDAPGRWGCIADWRPVVWEITAHLHANGEPRVDDDSRMFTADAAERHGLALIAAACVARRYADEHRTAGSGSGED